MSSTEPQLEDWLPKTQGLRFTIGEFHIGTRWFPALVLDRHPTQLPVWSGSNRIPLQLLSPTVEALVVHSHPILDRLPPISRLESAIQYVPAAFPHYLIDLEGPFSRYLETLPRKARHEMTRKVNKLKEHARGTLTFREYRDPEEMAEFHTAAVDLSRKTYQARLLQVGIPEGDDFRREIIRLAEQGRVRGYLLILDGAPFAFGYCCAKDDVLFYVHTGYDPGLSSWSPGIVLLYFMLERIFESAEFRCLDFGSGESQWKKYYSNRHVDCATIYFFRAGLRQRFWVHSHWLTLKLSDSIAGVLNRLGVKEKLKRLLRSGWRTGPGPQREMSNAARRQALSE